MIDFSKEIPYFEHGEFKWYIDKFHTNYIRTENANNLPSLNNMACFIVIGDKTKEYVVIDYIQNPLFAYSYPDKQEELLCKINWYKKAKHINDSEKKKH
mgnify:CR=1 FL=1